MKLRKRYLPVAAVLGAAVAVVPALAGATAPPEEKLEVAQNCHLPNWPCWNPTGTLENNVPENEVPPFKLAQGGMISFEDNDSKAPTDVIWKGTTPSCTPAVPSTPETPWSSTCTFATAGEYEFESQDLFKDAYSNYTKYKVVVAGTPTDATTSASGETQTEAMLNGSINPEGNTVEYHFEYEGPGVTGKQSTPTATLNAADSTSHSVSAWVAGLEPGMTYNFQLVATYGVGKTPVSGATQKMFTTHAVTAPTATTLAAEGLEETEVTLEGTVDPGGEATEYFFEYGTSAGYGQKTEKATVSANGGSQGVSATLKGLTPGTEYHFRLVAKNNQGPAEGLDRSFKTASPPTKQPPTKEPTPTATTSTQPSSGGVSTATTPGSIETPPPPAGGSPLATLALANAQHGDAVHGTIQIPATDGGARLEIELLAQGASLAKVKRSSSSRVGRLVRSSAPAGTVSFTVSLDAQAKRALRRHHKLALTVKIVITPKHRTAMTLTRSVVAR